MAKTRKPMTSVIIKDEVDEVLFRKDFIYEDVGWDYFDFMAYKTGASMIDFVCTDSRGRELQSWRLQLIYDLENSYDKRREMYISRA